MYVRKFFSVEVKTLNDVEALFYVIAVFIGLDGVLRKFQQNCVEPRTRIVQCASVLVDVAWGNVSYEINYFLIPFNITPEVHYCFLTLTCSGKFSCLAASVVSMPFCSATSCV